MQQIKQKLYEQCQLYVGQRIAVAKEAISVSQASANEETRSSAGDKYETGRAMMQLEIEKNSIQLNEALKLKRILDAIQPAKQCSSIEPGSLVCTNENKFYIAVSIGQVILEGVSYFVVAADSPIGMKMKGLRTGDSMTFNNKTFVIKEIW